MGKQCAAYGLEQWTFDTQFDCVNHYALGGSSSTEIGGAIIYLMTAYVTYLILRNKLVCLSIDWRNVQNKFSFQYTLIKNNKSIITINSDKIK